MKATCILNARARVDIFGDAQSAGEKAAA